MSGKDGLVARLAISGLSERGKENAVAFTDEVILAIQRAFLKHLGRLPKDERSAAITIGIAFIHDATGAMLARGGERVS